jgi:hypothetical protein
MKIAEATDPRRKYLMAASSDSGCSRVIPARM